MKGTFLKVEKTVTESKLIRMEIDILKTGLEASWSSANF